MMRRFVAGVLCTGVLAVSPAQADDEGHALDRIEVTGSRISYRDLLDVPAVAITKRGDYLSQGFTLINDTRSAEGRGKEIDATIRKLIARAGNRYAVVHDDGYAQTLTTASPPVATVDDPKRPDTSRVTLRVRVDIDSDDPAQIEHLRSTMGSGCEVSLDELNSRIEWEPVGPLELLLYLSYSMTVEGRGGGEESGL